MRGLFRLFSLTVLFALPLSSAYAASAYVDELQGTLTGQYGTAAPRALKIGDLLDSGVVLSTGANTVAMVKFEDGQIVALQSNTRFTVREYRYNVKQIKDSNILFQLVQGSLRFVTGVIGSTNRNAFRLNVGTATIGVRGTDASGGFGSGGEIGFTPSVGSLNLGSPNGDVVIPTGQFSIFAPGTPPAQPVPAAQAITRSPVLGVSINQARAIAVPAPLPGPVAALAPAATARDTVRQAERIAVAAPSPRSQQLLAQARSLFNAASQVANQAQNQALQTALGAGYSAPAAPAAPVPPPPSTTPQAAAAQAALKPVTAPVLTAAQAEGQLNTLTTSLTAQQTVLQQTQTSLGLPVTTPLTTLVTTPIPPTVVAPTPLVVPTPVPTPTPTPVSR